METKKKENSKKDKPTNKFLPIIKTIIIISICLRIKTGFKAIKELNKEIVNNRNLISKMNITSYNMVRFVDYESLEFNSIYIFKDFRKKYFNISSIIYTYNETENKSQIEYDFEIYDEGKNLIPISNQTEEFEVSCFYKNSKTKKYFSPILIDDKYYKCIDYFNILKTTKFGFKFTRKKASFNCYLDFDKILEPYKLIYTNKTY